MKLLSLPFICFIWTIGQISGMTYQVNNKCLYVSCVLRPMLHILCFKNNAQLQLSSGIILVHAFLMVPNYLCISMTYFNNFIKVLSNG